MYAFFSTESFLMLFLKSDHCLFPYCLGWGVELVISGIGCQVFIKITVIEAEQIIENICFCPSIYTIYHNNVGLSQSVAFITFPTLSFSIMLELA